MAVIPDRIKAAALLWDPAETGLGRRLWDHIASFYLRESQLRQAELREVQDRFRYGGETLEELETIVDRLRSRFHEFGVEVDEPRMCQQVMLYLPPTWQSLIRELPESHREWRWEMCLRLLKRENAFREQMAQNATRTGHENPFAPLGFEKGSRHGQITDCP